MSPPVDQKSFETAAPAASFGNESIVTSVGRRDHSWKNAQVLLRATAMLFSILSFVLLASDSQVILIRNLILVESFNDFNGYRSFAFLLISAASAATMTAIIFSAIPALSPTAFRASTATSIASALLAFITLGLSASMPAFKLSPTNI